MGRRVYGALTISSALHVFVTRDNTTLPLRADWGFCSISRFLNSSHRLAMASNIEEDILSDVVPSNIVSRQVRAAPLQKPPSSQSSIYHLFSPVKVPKERVNTTKRCPVQPRTSLRMMMTCVLSE